MYHDIAKPRRPREEMVGIKLRGYDLRPVKRRVTGPGLEPEHRCARRARHLPAAADNTHQCEKRHRARERNPGVGLVICNDEIHGFIKRLRADLQGIPDFPEFLDFSKIVAGGVDQRQYRLRGLPAFARDLRDPSENLGSAGRVAYSGQSTARHDLGRCLEEQLLER